MLKVSKHVVSARHKFKGEVLDLVIMDHTDAAQVTLELPWARLINGTCKLIVDDVAAVVSNSRKSSSKKKKSTEDSAEVITAEESDG